MRVGVSSMGELGPAIIADKQSVVLSWIAGDDEVGFVIKAAIALAAKTEAMLTPFHREGCNFITSSVVGVFVVTVENTLCSLGPVGRSSSSSSSSRHFVRCGCLSQVATIWTNVEKVFQFYSNDSVNRQIMIKVKKIGKCVCGHMSKRRDRLYVVSRVNGPPFRVRSLLRSHRRLRHPPCWSLLRSHSFWREVVERVGRYTPRGG